MRRPSGVSKGPSLRQIELTGGTLCEVADVDGDAVARLATNDLFQF